MNHYEILRIDREATQAETKKAYRTLVKQYHPDINDHPSAADQMILINEAYEILSNAATRNLYDLFLQGVPVKTVLEEVSPEQRYKAEYIRNKIRQQRERFQQQIHYKQKFYKYFRVFNIICFLAALIYSVDYYYDSNVYAFPVKGVTDSRIGTYVEFENGYKLKTSDEFYEAYHSSDTKNVTIHISAVLEVSRNIRLSSTGEDYKIAGTFYVFNNVFSIILFVSSIIVVRNKRYSDFRLTCGLLSFMTLLWLLLLTIPYF